ncbi:MAG: hypothetical protein WDM79_15255 [Terricaulis sp.]
MRKRLTAALALGFGALLITPASAAVLGWRVVHLHDEFTDEHVCRVEPGGILSRSIVRGLSGAFRTLHFIVENRDGEIRAGFLSEPMLPIGGDIQLRVDDNPMVTLAPADTPIDAGPEMPIGIVPNIPPEARAQLERSLRAARGMQSPYRLVVGERARTLLLQIVDGEDVRWRVITVNAAVSRTGRIRVEGLIEALSECGIVLR